VGAIIFLRNVAADTDSGCVVAYPAVTLCLTAAVSRHRNGTRAGVCTSFALRQDRSKCSQAGSEPKNAPAFPETAVPKLPKP